MKPMLMGAMLGAGMGLVQGKDPLKSALVGGATAGIGDKLMGAQGLFNLGGEQLVTDAATQGMGGMQNLGLTQLDAARVGASGVPNFGAMNTETISPFTPQGTSFLGTQDSVFGLGDPMSNQYMNSSLTQNLGADSVSNLTIPNTGLLKDTPNYLQKGTDLITDQFDGEMRDAEKMQLALGAAPMLLPKEEPMIQTPPPQVVPGKQASLGQPMAINVPRPNTVFQDPEREIEKLARRYS